MKRIGVISDTHGSFEKKFADFFKDCDEIWHCGDWGDVSVVDKMKAIAPVRGVYGNIDGQDIRIEYPEFLTFEIEGIRVAIIHIGGYPGRYQQKVRELISWWRPQIYLSGHSHILKVVYDKKNQLLHINPGAAGNSGFHKVKTAVKFDLLQKNISNLKVLEVDRKK